MKKLALCAALGLASSAFGAACVSGQSLQTFINNTSCTFGASNQYTLQDLTFVNPVLQTGSPLLSIGVNLLNQVNLGVAASDFTLTLGGTAGNPTVTLNPDSNVGVNSILGTELILFGFDITSNTPSIGFNNVNLTSAALTGLAAVGSIDEEDCYGGLLPVPSGLNLASLGNGGLACLDGTLAVGSSDGVKVADIGAGANVNIALPLGSPVTTSVDVLKEIQLTDLLGGASVASVTQGFSTANAPVPEPASIFFTGCGLLSLGIFTRRRAKR